MVNCPKLTALLLALLTLALLSGRVHAAERWIAADGTFQKCALPELKGEDAASYTRMLDQRTLVLEQEARARLVGVKETAEAKMAQAMAFSDEICKRWPGTLQALEAMLWKYSSPSARESKDMSHDLSRIIAEQAGTVYEAQARYLLGKGYAEHGDPASARKAYGSLIAKYPRCIWTYEAYMAVAGIHVRGVPIGREPEKWQEAIAWAEKVGPEDEGTYMRSRSMSARFLAYAGEGDGALAKLAELQDELGEKPELEPGDRWIRYLIAMREADKNREADRPTRTSRIGRARVDDVTPDSVSVAFSMSVEPEIQVTFALTKDVAVRLTKPANLADLQEPQWVTVSLDAPAPKGNDRLVARQVQIPLKARALSSARQPGVSQTPKERPIPLTVSGMLDMRGEHPMLTTDGQVLNLQFTDLTRIYREVSGQAMDVKPGAYVRVGFRMVDGTLTATQIIVFPEDGSALLEGN